MSKTIDERVVSMQFDNRNFENNVKTTIGTLDRLKEKLKFPGANKALDNISKSASKVNMNGLNSAVDTVQARFSALDVIGVTALANIANQAVNTGKRMISALTLDPIMSGFQEYETQINAVQTILANTQHKGSTLEDVNKALDELNKYADQTIYNFTEMTRNIGTFTAAGVDLDMAVSSIKGIANLAAVSGSNAQQASTAMYQLSQAIAAGKVQLMDWNSVVNAGMGGELFQNALKRTAEHFGYNVDGMIKKYGSFRESLTRGGWLTTEVLTETLTQLSGAYTEADLIAQGYSEKQAKEIAELAQTAVDSATKVKTFTQLFDTLKEAAQSGWTQTWEYIIGDFEQARELLTGISETVGGWINAMSDARNAIIGGAFDSAWSQLEEKINAAGVSTEKFQKELANVAKSHGKSLDQMIEKEGSLSAVIEKGLISKELVVETLKNIAGINKETSKSTEDMTAKLKKFQKVVNDVWRGDYKNVDTGRIEALKKAGYDYAEVQKLVNKTVDGHKLTLEDLSDAQLKAVGYTNKEVEAIRKLAEEAEKAGTPLNSLIERLNKPSGRELFWDSLANMAQPIITIFKAIGAAWDDAFPSDGGAGLYSFLETFHAFTEHLVIGDREAENLTRTLRGLFAILDMVSWVVGGSFKIAFTIASKVATTLWQALGLGNATILEITATIGDAIVAVRDWIEEYSLLGNAIEFVVPLIVNLGKAIAALIDYALGLPDVQKGFENFLNIFKTIGDYIYSNFGESIDAVVEFFDTLTSINDFEPKDLLKGIEKLGVAIQENFANVDLSTIGQNVIDGLVNGLQTGANAVWTAITTIAETLVNAAKNYLGIHSPSTVFMDIGQYIMEGLTMGLQNGLSLLSQGAKGIVDIIMDIFSGINFGDVFVLGSLGGAVFFLNKITNILDKFASPFEGFSDVLDGVGDVLGSVSKNIDQRTKNLKSEYLLNLAKAIGILALSLVALATVDIGKLWNAVAVVTVLGAGLMALMKVSEKVSGPAGKFEFAKLGTLMLAMSASMLIMSFALKKLAGVDFASGMGAVLELSLLMAAMAGVMIAFGVFVKADAAGSIDKAGKMFLKLSVSLGILALVIKLIGTMSVGDIVKGIAVLGACGLLFAAMSVLSLVSFNADKAGKMFTKMAVAIGILALVMKLIGTLSAGDISKGLAVITACSILFERLIAVSLLAGENADKAGKMLLKMSIAIGILALTIKLIATIDTNDVIKGGAVIAASAVLFKSLVEVSKSAGNNASKAGSMILKMSAAIGILALTIRLIAGLSGGDIVKGIAVIASCELLFAAIVKVSQYAGKNASAAGNMLMKMSVGIGVLAVAIKVLAGVSVGDIVKGTLAISALMGVMTLMIRISKSAGANADKAGTMLMKMTVPLIAIAGIITLLSFLDTKKVIVATGALSAVMGMFTLMTKVLGSLNGVKGTTGPLILMTVVVAMLGGILAVLQGLPVESTLANAAALSTLLLALSVSMTLISKIGAVSPMAIVAMGALTLIVGLIGGVLYLLQDMNVDAAIPLATSLSTLLLAMTGALAVLTVIGSMGPSSFIGIGSLLTLITSLGVVMGAIGALTTYFPQLEEFLNKGIGILQAIGEGLGSFVGGIVNGVLTAATEGLPEVGTKLSGFMDNLKPFIEGANTIDPKMAEGTKALAQAILYITGANLLDKITEFLTGSDSLAEFGEKLVPFGRSMVAYSEVVSGLDTDIVTKSAAAGQALAQLADNIPNSGGFLSTLVGDNTMDEWGSQLVGFGKSLAQYSVAVTGIDAEAITASATASEGLVKLAQELPNTGGLLEFIMGNNDMGEFGTSLVQFGTGLMLYSMMASTINAEAINNSVNAADALVSLSKKIDEASSGGFWDWLFGGGDDISDFGLKLIPFGEGLKKYSEKVAGISVENVNNSVTVANALSKMVRNMDGINTEAAFSFKAAIDALAKTNVQGFLEAFGQSSKKFIDSGIGAINGFIKGLKSGQKDVNSTMSTIAKGAVDALTKNKSNFNSAGEKLIKELNKGMDSSKRDSTKAAEKVAKAAAEGAKDAYDNFKTAGKYVVQGFAAGISANTYLASAKARAMAEAAARAAKKKLNIHSPSKVFYSIGDYAGQGFVNALSDYVDISYRSGRDMASSASDGLNAAIATIGKAFDIDTDIQPTISPVLDLSNVRSGVRSINGLFGTRQSLGVVGRVNALSGITANQNGTNNDVVGAIKDLKKIVKDLQGGGDTYTIGGITYSNGDEIAQTIRELVRIAKLEGRT